MKLSDKIITWLRERKEESGTKGLVVGLSGGVDSSACACLIKKACPENSLGVIMPIESVEKDREHALLLAEKIGLKTVQFDLTGPFKELFDMLSDSGETQLSRANIKPRLRMICLYYVANLRNYLVVGTGNRSEACVGYSTKHGDAACDILPIASLFKSEVVELCREMGVPEEILSKPPSAGLWEGQTDEGEMGFTYADIERFVNGDVLEPGLSEKIASMEKRNRHKLCMPPAFQDKPGSD